MVAQAKAMKAASKWIDDVPCELTADRAAHHVLTLRLDVAIKLAKGVDGKAVKSPEYVHQLRVATRRATAALSAFRFLLPDSVFKKTRKRLRRVRRVAG